MHGSSRRALIVSPPDWDELDGAVAEATWIADKNRKVGLASQYAERIGRIAELLESRDALFRSSPEILTAFPESAGWYVSLAGYSTKTLRQLVLITKRAGMERTAAGIVDSLTSSRRVKPSDLEAFSAWINHEIDWALPIKPSSQGARIRVALILGGKIVGVGQNSEGNDAVGLVKRLFLERLKALGCEIWRDGRFTALDPSLDPNQCSKFRFGGTIVLDFMGGGNRPDLEVSVSGLTLLVAEVKGRKDLSNVWESWMPQVADHLRTWTDEYRGASRMLLGTVITKEMIEGRSARGTSRLGLRLLHEQGLLDSVINVSKAVEGHASAVQAFDEVAVAIAEFV